MSLRMSERTQLGSSFAMDTIGPVAQKRFFGGYNVPALSVVIASISSFHKGALLGFSRAKQYDLLCKLIAQPGGESSVAEYCRTLAQKHWTEHGDESKSLFEYAARIEFPT
ncbi:MAG: hypothetical protein IH623_15630 [Verrucomicrobia bacterium]|nr:hypothetical protein [Verrucomicrobiota bacterium]